MGQLNRRVLPDPHPGRDAGEHRALGGPDQRAGAGGEVVLLQIHHADEPPADPAVRLGPLYINEGLRQLPKHALVQIPLHGIVDGGDMAIHIRVVQPCLRQDKAQRGGGVPHGVLHRLPVRRLGGKLVAGHHGPLRHVRVLWQQDAGGIEAQLLKLWIHIVSPFLYILFPHFPDYHNRNDRQADQKQGNCRRSQNHQRPLEYLPQGPPAKNPGPSRLTAPP